MRILARIVINAVALWLTTLIVTGVAVDPFGSGGAFETIVTFLFVALVFGIVNGTVGNLIRIVALPIYILTLGLISLVVNGLLLLLVSWISGLFGFGLHVDGFGTGVLAAIVLGIISWILGLIFRPLTRRD